jgi:hypothetical protein
MEAAARVESVEQGHTAVLLGAAGTLPERGKLTP